MSTVLVPRSSVLPFVLGLLLAASPSLLAAQNTKLNGPLVGGGTGGSVSYDLFASGGTRVVYRADREVSGQYELFSRLLDGSGPSVKLNGAMQPYGNVGLSENLKGSFQLGAGDRVVYRADETVEGVSELFSVPADGSAARVRISHAGQSVYPFQLDPAGARVVYQEGSFFIVFGPLYVVAVDGSSAPLTLTPGLDVKRFWISPDGATVLFSANDPGPADEALYAVPTDGSAAPLLLSRTHPDTSGFGFMTFRDAVFAPDGRVVYNELEDADRDYDWTLYSVPLDASQPESLLNDYRFFFGVFTLDPAALPVRVVFQTSAGVTSIASDGTQLDVLSAPGWRGSPLAALPLGNRVVFSDSLAGTGTTLFRGHSDGSPPAQALYTPGSNIVSFTMANPTHVAAVRSVLGSARQLGVVPLGGGTPLALHPLPPNSQGPTQVLPHPDGQRLLFIGNNETVGINELYVVPIDASSLPLKLNGPLDWNEDVLAMAVTPDLAHATYRAGVGNGGLVGLYRVPLDASTAPLQLNEPPPGGPILGDVTSFHVTADGARLVYRADQATDEEFDLYAVDLSTPGTWLPLTAGLASVLSDLALSPLNDGVLFVTQESPLRLRVASLVSGASVQLDSSTLGFVDPFVYSADGTRAVYRRPHSGADVELLSVAVDGLSPPALLHAPFPAGRTVSQFALGPSGVVVFLSDLGQDEVFELYAVPIEGGTPVRLSRTPVTGGDVKDFQIDPTGTRVVYQADSLVDGRAELFSTRLDASGLPVRLSGFMPPLGDVTHFAITADGGSVVYRADQVGDARFDLFSVPIDGVLPPVGRPGGERRYGPTLLTALGATRSVQGDWTLTPDGVHVVYRANAVFATNLELYRVPVDGSTTPVQLGGPLFPNGDVLSFAIAPNQGHVVYRADQRIDETFEVFSVPLAGGNAVALDVMPAFGDVGAYRIAPDSADVVFSADRDVNDVVELYRVPIDGSGPSVKVNPALASAGDVETDFVALTGKTVYRADQDLNETLELYLDE